jgi:hypothetical protein
MKKSGLIGIIILSILVFFLVAGTGAAVYFYNYHVFKEVRICAGEGQDSQIPCETQRDCLDFFNFSDDMVDDAPAFIKENFNNVLDSSLYCNGSCFLGKVRGVNYETGELEELESCLDNEREILMEIRGKEGIEILQWMRKSSK